MAYATKESIPFLAVSRRIMPSPIGYHVADIPKGVFGDPSKVVEEAREFEDAMAQGSSLMALLELSDLYGAMEGFLAKHHPSMAMSDLALMSSITQRAFRNGKRS